jgi:hypothetical protein
VEVRPQEILENNVGVRPVRHDIEDGRHPHAVACRDVRLHLLGSFEARSARGQAQRLGPARVTRRRCMRLLLYLVVLLYTWYKVRTGTVVP